MSEQFDTSRDAETILQTILDQLDRQLACDACGLLLLGGGVLRMAASRGFAAPEAVRGLEFDLSALPELRQVLAGGRPVVAADVQAAAPFGGTAGFAGLRACLQVPLQYQERAIGLLLVLKQEADYYGAGEAETAQAFASQAAIAIEHARLYAETRRRAVHLEAASEVSQAVTAILEVDELLAQVLELIRERFGYYHVHIFLVDGRTNEIVLRQSSGPAQEPINALGLRIKIGEQGITGWVARTGQPLLCNDVSVEPRYYAHELLPETRSELALPLRVGDVVVGVLDVQSEQRDAFHEEDVTALQIVADQVAIAIENAHLFQQSRRQVEAMRALHEISLKIASQLDGEQVLDVILKEAAQLLHAQGSTFAIYDHKSNLIRLRAAHNIRAERLRTTFRLGEGVTGRVVASGQPLIVNDYRHWGGRSPAIRLSSDAFDAVMGVPLRWEGQVLGALCVLDSGERRPFNEDDVQLLSLFADLASIALKNAELYEEVAAAGEQLAHKVETLRALHDISLHITSQLDSEQALDVILKAAAQLLHAQGSTFAVHEPRSNLVRKVAVYNVRPEYEGVALRLGEGAVGHVIATGEPVIVNDYPQWPGRSKAFQDSPYDAILSVPLRWEGRVFGALCVLDSGERRPFTDEDVQLLSLFGDLASIALKNAELYEEVTRAGQQLEQKVAQRTQELARARGELARKAEQLQRLLTVTVHVQEEERTRIARDLHDGSNQIVTGTLFEIQAAQQSVRDQRMEVALDKLETAKRLLRQIESENRRIIAGLRPSILDAKGLVAALQWQAANYQEQFGMTCAVRVVGTPVRLSPEAEIAVYRIVQESLNNVAAHAEAGSVQVRVEFTAARLLVVIEDDGVGFDYENVLTNAPGRMGLIGIRERAQSIGGEIRLRSLPQLGTRIALDVPLPNGPPRPEAPVATPQSAAP